MMKRRLVCLLLQSSFMICTCQPPEINDQYGSSTVNTNSPSEDISGPIESSVREQPSTTSNTTTTTLRIDTSPEENARRQALIQPAPIVPGPHIIIKLYNIVANAVKSFIWSPKFMTVLKNIGTCVVNGVLDIIAYFVPAPFIPLIASVAGMVVPFEPIVTMKERMPVSSYRRALSSAADTFLSSFDKFKQNLMDDDFDPYMTKRFNRRMHIESKRKHS